MTYPSDPLLVGAQLASGATGAPVCFFCANAAFFPARKLVTNPPKSTKLLESVGQVPHTRIGSSISTLSFLQLEAVIQVSSFERRHFSYKNKTGESGLQRAAGPLSRERSQGARRVGHHHPPFLERVPVVTGAAPRDHLILENVVVPLSTRTGGWPKQTLPIHNSLSARLGSRSPDASYAPESEASGISAPRGAHEGLRGWGAAPVPPRHPGERPRESPRVLWSHPWV